jgi:tRNA U38,U39,U40 pseudouridine synthase TruA
MLEVQKEFINGLLQRYSGTHNFHNFTVGKKSDDPSAMRVIKSISVCKQ